MKASEIRSAFLEFFSKRGHVILPSAPVVVSASRPSRIQRSMGMAASSLLRAKTSAPEIGAPRPSTTRPVTRTPGARTTLPRSTGETPSGISVAGSVAVAKPEALALST